MGHRVVLECHALLHNRIDWRHYTSADDYRFIYWQNTIFADRSRFSVNRPEAGIFDLVINSVNTSDAGIYKCLENNGRYPGEACTEVVVNYSVGQSDLLFRLLHVYAQAVETLRSFPVVILDLVLKLPNLVFGLCLRLLSLAIPLWIGAASNGDGHDRCWRRNSEFSVTVDPVIRTAGILIV